jgi:hypothetical protein
MLASVPDKSQTSSRLNVSPVITPVLAVVWPFKIKMYVTGSIQDSFYVLWAVHAGHANPSVCDSVTQLFASGYKMSCWWSGEWVRRCYWFHPTRDAGHLDKIMSVSAKQIRLHCMCVCVRGGGALSYALQTRVCSLSKKRTYLPSPSVYAQCWQRIMNRITK